MLDVDSITGARRRYRVSTEHEELQNRRDGIGENERTGKYVDGNTLCLEVSYPDQTQCFMRLPCQGRLILNS
jgi:hypothetical protein